MSKPLHITHGGISNAVFAHYGLEPRPVVDFSVNISPLGVPDAIRAQWANWMDELEHYPSESGDGVARFYQKRFNLPPETILPANGSIELIYQLPRLLNLKSITIPQPAFSDYTRAAQAAGSLLSHEAPDADTQALFIGSPNNPNGVAIPAEQLLQWADRYPDRWLIVDQAFVQYSDPVEAYSLLSPAALRPNLIVLHSLTKFYALPGLRIGAAISHPDTIRYLKNRQMPWSVNRLAERAAEVLSAETEYDQQTYALNRIERTRLALFFQEHPRFNQLAESQANFLLIQAQQDLDLLLPSLLQQGIYVRDAHTFSGLPPRCLRMSIRTEAENNQLMEALNHV